MQTGEIIEVSSHFTDLALESSSVTEAHMNAMYLVNLFTFLHRYQVTKPQTPHMEIGILKKELDAASLSVYLRCLP